MDSTPRDRFQVKIKEFLQGEGMSLPLQTIFLLRSPVVYIFLRSDKVIYVGQSKNGILRVFDKRHIKKFMDMIDEVMIYRAKDARSAKLAEGLLIRALRPEMNHNGFGYMAQRSLVKSIQGDIVRKLRQGWVAPLIREA